MNEETLESAGKDVCRVIADYRVTYTDPLIVSAGEELHVGQEDDEYRGWVWCTNRKGKSGWIPISYIERKGEAGIARYDYEATELSANLGEELMVGKELNGWAWCTNRNGASGWLPVANLEKIMRAE